MHFRFEDVPPTITVGEPFSVAVVAVDDSGATSPSDAPVVVVLDADCNGVGTFLADGASATTAVLSSRAARFDKVVLAAVGSDASALGAVSLRVRADGFGPAVSPPVALSVAPAASSISAPLAPTPPVMSAARAAAARRRPSGVAAAKALSGFALPALSDTASATARAMDDASFVVRFPLRPTAKAAGRAARWEPAGERDGIFHPSFVLPPSVPVASALLLETVDAPDAADATTAVCVVLLHPSEAAAFAAAEASARGRIANAALFAVDGLRRAAARVAAARADAAERRVESDERWTRARIREDAAAERCAIAEAASVGVGRAGVAADAAAVRQAAEVEEAAARLALLPDGEAAGRAVVVAAADAARDAVFAAAAAARPAAYCQHCWHRTRTDKLVWWEATQRARLEAAFAAAGAVAALAAAERGARAAEEALFFGAAAALLAAGRRQLLHSWYAEEAEVPAPARGVPARWRPALAAAADGRCGPDGWTAAALCDAAARRLQRWRAMVQARRGARAQCAAHQRARVEGVTAELFASFLMVGA